MITVECPHCGGPAEDHGEYDLNPRQHKFECLSCGSVFMRYVC